MISFHLLKKITFVYIHVKTPTNIYIDTYINIYTRTEIHVHEYDIYIYIYIYIYTYIYIYYTIYIYICYLQNMNTIFNYKTAIDIQNFNKTEFINFNINRYITYFPDIYQNRLITLKSITYFVSHINNELNFSKQFNPIKYTTYNTKVINMG